MRNIRIENQLGLSGFLKFAGQFHKLILLKLQNLHVLLNAVILLLKLSVKFVLTAV